MKNYVLGSLLALAAAPMVACTTSTTDAHIAASWSFKTLATNSTTGCPSGFDTAALYTQAADASGAPIGTCTAASATCFIDLFNCTDNSGVSAPLPPQNYITWLEVTDHSGATVYAQSLSQIVDVTDVDKAVTFPILNDGGYFELAWNLVGAVSNSTLSCSVAPGGVEAVSTVSGTSQMVSDIFTCSDGSGVTAPLLAAAYTVSVDAMNSAMQAVGVAPAINGTVQVQNQVTKLGTITIPIDGM